MCQVIQKAENLYRSIRERQNRRDKKRTMDEEEKLAKTAQKNNHDLMLLAIQNKFASGGKNQTPMPSVFNFNIPALKSTKATPLNGLKAPISGVLRPTEKESPLKALISKRLQDNQTPSKTSTDNGGDSLHNIDLNVAFSNLKIASSTSSKHVKPEKMENPQPIIDLRMALTTTGKTFSGKIQERLQPTEEMDFEISFIECDRRMRSKALREADVHCQLDVSHVQYQHYLVPPSSFGRILCLRYGIRGQRRPFVPPFKPIVQSDGNSNHNLKRFLFDSKSPDDVIIESLDRYNKRPK